MREMVRFYRSPIIYVMSYTQYMTVMNNQGSKKDGTNTVTIDGITFTWLSNSQMKASVAGTWTFPTDSGSQTSHYNANEAFSAPVIGWQRIFIPD